MEALRVPPADMQLRRPPEALRTLGRRAGVRSDLGEGGVQVALQLVSLMQGILEPALCGRQGLLTLTKGL